MEECPHSAAGAIVIVHIDLPDFEGIDHFTHRDDGSCTYSKSAPIQVLSTRSNLLVDFFASLKAERRTSGASERKSGISKLHCGRQMSSRR